MTFGILFGMVIVPAMIILTGVVCYFITGKKEEKEDY